jgi:uncharacterized protein
MVPASTLAIVLGFLALAPCSAFQSPAPPDTYLVTLPGATDAAGKQPVWTSSTDAGAAAAGVNGLMWKASAAKHTAYLLGSIHAATSSIYPLPPQIEEAFQNASVLVVEVDINKVNRQAFQGLVAAKGLYPANDSLWNHVTPETKTLAVQFCADHHLPLETFGRMRPWLATLTASAAPMQTAGMDPELGIDKHFLDNVKDGMRVEQLETAEWQLRLLSDMPEIQQEKSLAATLKGSDTSRRIGEQLEAAWVSGDAAKLDAISSRSWVGAAEMQKRVYGDRNPHMADAVEQCLKGADRCFVVVGAGHLVGQEGVVRLLQRRGYKVEQVFSAN